MTIFCSSGTKEQKFRESRIDAPVCPHRPRLSSLPADSRLSCQDKLWTFVLWYGLHTIKLFHLRWHIFHETLNKGAPVVFDARLNLEVQKLV